LEPSVEPASLASRVALTPGAIGQDPSINQPAGRSITPIPGKQRSHGARASFLLLTADMALLTLGAQRSFRSAAMNMLQSDFVAVGGRYRFTLR
jgi:hypothetical protein